MPGTARTAHRSHKTFKLYLELKRILESQKWDGHSGMRMDVITTELLRRFVGVCFCCFRVTAKLSGRNQVLQK